MDRSIIKEKLTNGDYKDYDPNDQNAVCIGLLENSEPLYMDEDEKRLNVEKIKNHCESIIELSKHMRKDYGRKYQKEDPSIHQRRTIVVLEELAELGVEICNKFQMDPSFNTIGLYEELADVFISLNTYCIAEEINPEDLHNIENIKSDRIMDTISNKDTFF